jgi:hypothetical protein
MMSLKSTVETKRAIQAEGERADVQNIKKAVFLR